MKKLRNIQRGIAKKVILKDDLKDVRLITGFAVSYKGREGTCSGVVIDNNLGLVEKKNC